MRPIQDWFDEYAESHQNKTNKLIHWICIPLIFFSILGLLTSIPNEMLQDILPSRLAPFANWGNLVLLLALIFYVAHSLSLTIGLLVFSAFCAIGVYGLNQFSMPLWKSSLIIFIAAWIGQFYGHKIEGKKPSFFKDVQFLLIGPAWLMGFIYKTLGIRY